MTDDLNEILEGCIRGQRKAQERIYQMFSAGMFGVCLRYCRNYNDAKDVLQDGFVKIFENIKKFENRGSFEGWIRKIIVNTALEKFRKTNPVILVEKLPDMPEEEEYEPNPDFNADVILSLVQELPSQYRLVFNLYVFEEMTHREISNLLSISEGTSKSDLSRARSILRQKLKDRAYKVLKTG